MDPRQHTGRFGDTIAAAALTGSVASGYGATDWTGPAIRKPWQFAFAPVLTFTAGMVALEGEK
jgi:hypothetical protein